MPHAVGAIAENPNVLQENEISDERVAEAIGIVNTPKLDRVLGVHKIADLDSAEIDKSHMIDLGSLFFVCHRKRKCRIPKTASVVFSGNIRMVSISLSDGVKTSSKWSKANESAASLWMGK